MFDLIVASTPKFGIGLKNGMAWHCSEELKLFRNLTRNSVLIMGRKTVENLPRLKNRTIFCVSRNPLSKCRGFENECFFFTHIENAIENAIKKFPDKRIFVAGGSQIYNYCFQNLIDKIDTVYLSIMKKEYECDSFISLTPRNWMIMEEKEHEEFTHYVLKHIPNGELEYLNLLSEVLNTGNTKIGRNGETHSLFGKHLEFDLRQGFPLLTSKKMFFRGIVEELLFFIRGETDSKKLEEKRVNIWKGNTSREFLDSIGKTERREGVMGEMYGYQWRHYNAEYDEEKAKPKEPGIDQLKNVISLIKNEPNSRRILMTDYNPCQASSGVLYPCHSLILQFYVEDEFLDMFCYNRSQDLFHGTPFNIASSSLLLCLIAKITNKTPRKLILSLGDCHIYSSHYDIVAQQLSRLRYSFCSLKIPNISSMKEMEALRYEDFSIENYSSFPSLKAKMVA